MSNSAEIKELRSLLDEILNVYRDEIYKKEIFQESTFKGHGKEQFDKSFKLLNKVRELDFDLLDDAGVISSIKNHVQELKNLFEQAKALDTTDAGSDPAHTRSQLVSQVKQARPRLFEEVRQFIDHRRETDTNIPKLEEQLQRGIELTEQMEAKSKKSDAILSAMETTSGKAGVSANAEHYKKASNEHANKAKSWFKRGAWLLVGLVVFVAIACR